MVVHTKKVSAQSLLTHPNWFWTLIQVNEDTIIPRDDLSYLYWTTVKSLRVVTTGGLHIDVGLQYQDDVFQECCLSTT